MQAEIEGWFSCYKSGEGCDFRLQHTVFTLQCTERAAAPLSCVPKLVFYEPCLQFPDETGCFRLQTQARNPRGARWDMGRLRSPLHKGTFPSL